MVNRWGLHFGHQLKYAPLALLFLLCDLSIFLEAQMKFDRMRRRDFITLLGGAAAARPLAVHAQAPNLPTIGFLSIGFSASFTTWLDAFQQGLSELGYVKSRNVVIADHWAEGNYDKFDKL